jgi:hypothetical protein
VDRSHVFSEIVASDKAVRSSAEAPKTRLWCFALGFWLSWLCVMMRVVEMRHKEPYQTCPHHEKIKSF